MIKEILFKDLSYQIIGACFKVHASLGCGLPEICYQNALSVEFKLRSIPYTEQEEFNIFYKDFSCGHFHADFIIDDKIILELKSKESITSDHYAQLFTYLRATKLKVGYIINFKLKSLQFKRLIL